MGEGALHGRVLGVPHEDGVHGLGAVFIFEFQLEHVGAAHLLVNLHEGEFGHLHGDVLTVGGVVHAGHEGFGAKTTVGTLAEASTLLHRESFQFSHDYFSLILPSPAL